MNKADTDGDGWTDGQEIMVGAAPLSGLSTVAIPRVPLKPWPLLLAMGVLIALSLRRQQRARR